MADQQSKTTVDEMRAVDKNGAKAVDHRDQPSGDPKAKVAESVAEGEKDETADRTGRYR